MESPPPDINATRAAIAARGLLPTAAGYMTADVADRLPFDALGPFKNLLKQFFSPAPWSDDDATALSDIVSPHVDAGWWEHDLGGGITLTHGILAGSYLLWVSGASDTARSLFDRTFDGPVVPEATPHPRKVKFTFGGRPSAGTWHRRGDADLPADEHVRRLLAEPDVTDVMVAGDFVTIGLSGRSPWEKRLEPLLALVTELFAEEPNAASETTRTRDELLREAAHTETVRADADLHLLDPNDLGHAARLEQALDDPDPKIRRIAVAILAEADEAGTRQSTVERGYRDASRIVRRTAVDAAADAEDPALREFLERALGADDAWVRWRAARAIGTLGIERSRAAIEALTSDPEFRVRFEAERVLHAAEEPQ